MSVARVITSPLIQPFFCGEAPVENESSKKVKTVALNAIEQKGIRNGLRPVLSTCMLALAAVVVLSALVITLSLIFAHPFTALICGILGLLLMGAILFGYFPC